MKTDIHPKYEEAQVHCSCGEKFTTRSTKDNIGVEICSKCHPFYTGQQKFVDSGGRVERFQKKFAKQQSAVSSRQSEKKQSAVSNQQSEEKPSSAKDQQSSAEEKSEEAKSEEKATE